MEGTGVTSMQQARAWFHQAWMSVILFVSETSCQSLFFSLWCLLRR